MKWFLNNNLPLGVILVFIIALKNMSKLKAYKFYSVLFIYGLLTCPDVFAQAKIIIKLDDIGIKNNSCKASPVIDVLQKRKVKAALGVIANNLDSTALNVFSNYLKATDAKGNKLFEIWHHGLYHSNNNPPNNNREFDGTSFEFQQEHFNRADQLVLKYLDVQMHSFGAPYNASDANTNKVIAANPNYKVFMLTNMKEPEVNGVMNLNNRINMESATGVVNYDYFIDQYQKFKDKYPDYIVLQGHPMQWDAERIAEFNKILDYLVAQRCEFVLPYQYYLSAHKK
jgi:peptidoglycan/xylan/chitin deacetylase (PgdA/CDA1 family)